MCASEDIRIQVLLFPSNKGVMLCKIMFHHKYFRNYFDGKCRSMLQMAKYGKVNIPILSIQFHGPMAMNIVLLCRNHKCTRKM